MTEDKFYWIKLRTNFYRKKEIDYLLSLEEGASYVVIYIQLCFSTANNGGRLEEKIGEITIPYTTKKIALDLKYFSEDIIDKALTLFQQLGLICEENGVLKIVNFEKMVGFETKWAEKKREYRQKNKNGDKTKDNLVDKVEDNVEDNVLNSKEDNVRQDIRDKSIEYKSIDIKEKEIKKEKEKVVAAAVNKKTIFEILEENFARTLSSVEYEHVNSWEDNELTRYAIEVAIINGVKKINYIESILNRYKEENITTVEEAKASEEKFKNKSKNNSNGGSKEWI